MFEMQSLYFQEKVLAKICLMNRTRQENGNEIPNWVMCYLEEKNRHCGINIKNI